jgi:hypothetical protein
MRSSPARSTLDPDAGGVALGPCPICGRPMIEGPSVDRHHFVPRSEGGREAVPVHRVCHRKLHSLWTERELAQLFSTPEAIRAHPEMQRFVRWLRRKPPEFWVRTEQARSKGQRRG